MSEETGRTEDQTQADDVTNAQQTQGGGAVPPDQTRKDREHEERNGQNPDADEREPARAEEYPAGGTE